MNKVRYALIGIALLLVFLFFSCDSFLLEPDFLKYPFELEAHFEYSDYDEYGDDFFVDRGNEGSYYILQWDWNDSDSDTVYMYYYDLGDDILRKGKFELPSDFSAEGFYSTGNKGVFVLICNDNANEYKVILVVTAEPDGGKLDFTIETGSSIEAGDFSLSDLEPDYYYFEDDRLYFIKVEAGNLVYEFSYKVTTDGITDPRERPGGFASTQEIIDDYFLAETEAETFWGEGRFNIVDYYYDVDTDNSYFIGYQDLALENDQLYFAFNYEDGDLGGEKLDFERMQKTDVINADGEIAVETEEPESEEDDQDQFIFTIADKNLNKTATITMNINDGNDWRYLGTAELDGTDKALFIHPISPDPQNYSAYESVAIYSLPLDFFYERMEE